MNKVIPLDKNNFQINNNTDRVQHKNKLSEGCINQSSDLFLNTDNVQIEFKQLILSKISKESAPKNQQLKDTYSPNSGIQFNEFNHQRKNQNENHQESNKSHSNVPSKNIQQCRICLQSIQDEEAQHLGQLISICDCKGSIQFVHFVCQKDLLETKNGKTLKMLEVEADRLRNEPSAQQKKLKGIQFHKCDLCGYNYEVEWKSSLKFRPISHMKTKKKCYLYSFFVLFLSFLLLAFGLIYISLQYSQILQQYYLIEYFTFDFFDLFLAILNSETEVFLYNVYNILQSFLFILHRYPITTKNQLHSFRYYFKQTTQAKLNNQMFFIQNPMNSYSTFYYFLKEMIFTYHNILLLIRIDFDNQSKITETIFSFLGYILIIFAIISNIGVLLAVSFRLFFVRTYFVNSFPKYKIE